MCDCFALEVTTQDHQLNAAQAAAEVVDGLFHGVSLDRSLTRATMMANALSEACVVAGVSTADAPRIIDRVNQYRLSEGYEILLAQKPLGPSSGYVVTNTLRYCPNGTVCLLS